MPLTQNKEGDSLVDYNDRWKHKPTVQINDRYLIDTQNCRVPRVYTNALLDCMVLTDTYIGAQIVYTFMYIACKLEAVIDSKDILSMLQLTSKCSLHSLPPNAGEQQYSNAGKESHHG